MLLVKEARHAFLLKEPGLVVQCAFAGSGFFGTLSRRLSEKDDRAQPFIRIPRGNTIPGFCNSIMESKRS